MSALPEIVPYYAERRQSFWFQMSSLPEKLFSSWEKVSRALDWISPKIVHVFFYPSIPMRAFGKYVFPNFGKIDFSLIAKIENLPLNLLHNITKKYGIEDLNGLLVPPTSRN